MNARPHILVVADDLTGAAEIAGIGVEFGMAARIVRPRVGEGGGNLGEAGLVVVDTDTRGMDAVGAAARVVELLRGFSVERFSLVFKKTDSLLRGNVAAEVLALGSLTGHSRFLLLPQNPSKGRVIRGGVYFVDGVRLDETAFRGDPEHPRFSARVAELLAPAAMEMVSVGQGLPLAGLIVANAERVGEVEAIAGDLAGDTLPAGGSDFFRALLERRLGMQRVSAPAPAESSGPRLVVAGSASAYSREMVRLWQAQGLGVFAVPEGVLIARGAAALAGWLGDVPACLQRGGLAILAVTHAVDASRAAAFRDALGAAVRYLLALPALLGLPLRIYIEGGATAAAVVDLLGWREFDVVGAVAPGVVTLRPRAAGQILLTIKPGSYPWPACSIDSW